MTITIETPQDVEEAIKQKAAREGLSVQDYALHLLVQDAVIAPEPYYDHSAAVFAKWEADDPVSGPEDHADRQREGDAIIDSIQANRLNFPRDPELVALIESMNEEDKTDPKA